MPDLQFSPEIYDDIVIWTDYRNGNYDVYGCYLSAAEWTPTETPPAKFTPSESLEPSEPFEFPDLTETEVEVLIVVIAAVVYLLDWLKRRKEENSH